LTNYVYYFIQSLEIEANTKENTVVDEERQLLDRNIESTEEVIIQKGNYNNNYGVT